MKLCLIIPLLCLLLVGCMSSPGKRYYQLHIPAPDQAAERSIDKTVLVDRVLVESMYDEFRLIYRTSPFQLNYFPYDFWIKKPGELVRNAIYDFLWKQGVFKKVVQSFSEGDVDYQLKTRLNAVEEYDLDQVWYARLAMEIEIIDFRSSESMISHRFDRSKKLISSTVEWIPHALSSILAEELKIVMDKFVDKIDLTK